MPYYRILVTCLIALVACAAMPFTTASAKAAEFTTDQARTYVDEVAHQVLNIISVKTTTKATKKTQLEKIFSSHVDMPWVGRFALGRFWRQASDAQRTRYLKEYQSFLLSNYASRFAEYSSGTYKINGATDDGDGQFTVSMEMASNEGSQPVQVEYKLHAGQNNTLQLFDIVVEGVSMIQTQRSEFASVLSQKGLDYLIEQLANKSMPLPDAKAS